MSETESLRAVLEEMDHALRGFEEQRGLGLDPSVAGKMWEARLKRWRPTLTSALARLEAAGQDAFDRGWAQGRAEVITGLKGQDAFDALALKETPDE